MDHDLSPEVRRRILEEVSTGRYGTADEVVLRGLTLLQEQEETLTPEQSPAEDLALVFAKIAGEVPGVDWEAIPADLSLNLVHHLYGSKNKS